MPMPLFRCSPAPRETSCRCESRRSSNSRRPAPGPGAKRAARNAVGLLGCLVLCLNLSCDKSRVPVYPVRGAVLCQGRAAAGAFVIFHPVTDSESIQRMRPHGVVGPDGTFVLMTYLDADGAPAGDYRVTIEWPAEGPRDPSDPNDSESEPTGPDRLRGRYANPDTSGLRATVAEGENQLDPFEIR